MSTATITVPATEWNKMLRTIGRIDQTLNDLIGTKADDKGFVRIGRLMKVTGLSREQVRLRRNKHADNPAIVKKSSSGHYIYNLKEFMKLA